MDTFLEERSRGTRVLKRVIRLYNRISMLGTGAAKAVVDIPLELITLLEHAEAAPVKSQAGVVEVVTFFAAEARPIDVLVALVRKGSPTECNSQLYPVYQIALQNGIRDGASTEMSGSLLRVIQAHTSFEETVPGLQFAEHVVDFKPVGVSISNVAHESLWSQLSHGTLVLNK